MSQSNVSLGDARSLEQITPQSQASSSSGQTEPSELLATTTPRDEPSASLLPGTNMTEVREKSSGAHKGDSSRKCMICRFRPKNASLVHRSIGHQICCVPCGMRLRNTRSPCPVCGQPIKMVLRVYGV